MTWNDLAKLGYEVGPASDGVLVISGFGIQSLYVKADDQETLDQLCDPDAHAERVLQASPDYAPPQERLEVAAPVRGPLPKDASLQDVIAAFNSLTGAA